MKVVIHNSQKILKISKIQVRLLVIAVIAGEKQNCDEVVIHFVSKTRISQIHAEFFDDPSPTDCITFLVDENSHAPYRVLGEVFVCPEVAIEYASKHDLDPYQETSLYIIHGLLHLMGYKDMEKSEKAQMRRAERRHEKRLQQLNIKLTPC